MQGSAAAMARVLIHMRHTRRYVGAAASQGPAACMSQELMQGSTGTVVSEASQLGAKHGMYAAGVS